MLAGLIALFVMVATVIVLAWLAMCYALWVLLRWVVASLVWLFCKVVYQNEVVGED